jgi:hypothetical protein
MGPDGFPGIVKQRRLLRDALFLFIILSYISQSKQQHIYRNEQQRRNKQEQGPVVLQAIGDSTKYNHCNNIEQQYKSYKPNRKYYDIVAIRATLSISIIRQLPFLPI